MLLIPFVIFGISIRYKGSCKPMSFAMTGEGGDELALHHRICEKVLLVTLHIRSKFLDDIVFEFSLEEVERTETDTLKEMLDAQEVRLRESEQLLEGLRESEQLLREQHEKKPAFLTVSSDTAAGNQAYVVWNTQNNNRVVSDSHFKFSL